jgi:predicted transcriptional regulator
MNETDGSTSQMGNEKLESEILSIVRKSSGTWIEDLARKTGRNRATVKVEVARLEAAGRVKIVKKGNMKEIWPAKE